MVFDLLHPETFVMEQTPIYKVRQAMTPDDLIAVQKLRYEIFVIEMGAKEGDIDHIQKLEQDKYDPFCKHLMLIDVNRGSDPIEQVVGVYRILTQRGAKAAGGYYTANEFDLGPLLNSGRKIIELGRSCLRKSHRGGIAMLHLWQALNNFVKEEKAEVLFGTASFQGTDIQSFVQPFSLLHYEYLTPKKIRPKAIASAYVPLDQLEASQIERVKALKAMPALIKAYLRLGGGVADGAFIDYKFNTIDVCMILDLTKMNIRQKSIYSRKLN